MHRLGILAVVALSLACGGGGEESTVETPVEPESPFEPGRYRAGFVLETVTYTSALTGERTLPLRVWYPADADSSADAANYLAGYLADWLGGLGELIRLVGNALDGPPVASGGPFPVVVYSHSSDSDGLFAYEYAENLAEHGWIFLAPNHTGDTAIDRLTDSEIDRALSLALRPEDVEASLDWLESDANVVGLEGAADTSNAMMLGHSRGGTTALMLAGARLDVDALAAACQDDCDAYEDPEIVSALESSRLDSRFTAIVAQAPASVLDFGAGELAGIGAPVMLMTGDLDMTTPEAAMAWDLLDGAGDVWVRLPNGAHLTFLSICEDLDPLLDFLLPDAVTDGCGPDFVRPEDVVDVLRGYVLAYGERWVLGDEDWDEVLRPPPLDEQVEITVR